MSLRQLALPAGGPRLRVRHLQVRVEDGDVAGDDVGHRIDARERQVGRRAEVGAVAEEDRSRRAEVAERVVPVRRLRDAGVVVDRAGEVGHAGAVVAERVAGAEHAVAFVVPRIVPRIAAVAAQRPREAEVRREVVAVGVVGALALVVLHELAAAARSCAPGWKRLQLARIAPQTSADVVDGRFE